MNTGHKGVISTTHANSAKDGLLRLAQLFCFYSETKGVDYKFDS